MKNNYKESFEQMKIAGTLASETLDEVTSFVKPGITTDALDKTIFRVNGKDYTPTQLTKKFMVPMTVPNTNQSQPEQVVERVEPKLISVTPFDADSAWVADSTTWMEPAVEDTTYK